MADFVYITGPTGRNLCVDSEGRLICNADASTSGFVFGYGEKGYPLVVDGAGHLLVNPSGLNGSGSGLSEEALLAASGHLQSEIDELDFHTQNLFTKYRENTALGSGALVNIDETGAGRSNTAVGHMAANALTTEDRNVAIGNGAMQLGTGGNGNVAIGQIAAYSASGDSAVIIGIQAGVYMPLGSDDNVAVGLFAGYNTNKKAITNSTLLGPYVMQTPGADVDSVVAIGYEAGKTIVGGSHDVFVGTQAGLSCKGGHNIGIGRWALTNSTASAMSSMNIGIGFDALGAPTAAGISDNIAIGQSAGREIAGTNNVLLGFYAGAETDGNYNIAIGSKALEGTGAGDGGSNIAIGQRASDQFKSGYIRCIAMGHWTGKLAGGQDNINIGTNAGYNGSGNDNVVIGHRAGQDIIASGNVAIGYHAGKSCDQVAGVCNTLIGSDADVDSGSVAYATAIGTGAIASGSNQIRIGRQEDEVHCENLKVQQQMLHRGCYGEVYEDNPAGTTIDIASAGTFYPMPSGYIGEEAGAPYVTVVTTSGSLLIGNDGAGLYQVHASLSYGGTVDILSEAAIHVNGAIQHNCHIKRKLSAAGDVGSITITGLIRLVDGDVVDIRFTSDTNGDDIDLNHANLNIHRIAR
jgi:hypothetical protein